MGDLRRTQTRLCDESDKSKLRSDQLQKQVMDLNSKIVDFQSRSMRGKLVILWSSGTPWSRQRELRQSHRGFLRNRPGIRRDRRFFREDTTDRKNLMVARAFDP